MGWFSSKKEGGLMDVICSKEKNYLIWQWSPSGEPSRKMNAIRYGSRLHVEPGEVAVFLYDSDKGMDFIEGYKDEVLKTANFPVLSSIVGTAFGGNSPFIAQVFFINLAGTIDLPFFVDNFSVTEPDPDMDLIDVPVSVKGVITFNIGDYRRFVEKFRLQTFSMDDLSSQIRGALPRYIKSIVGNAPEELQIPIVKLSRSTNPISTAIEEVIREPLERDFAIKIARFDITDITLDKESEGYQIIKEQGKEKGKFRGLKYKQRNENFEASGEFTRENMGESMRNARENQVEAMRITREETQRRQRLQSEQEFIRAHQIDVQGEVGLEAAKSLGTMGGGSLGSSEGDGSFNPGAMMAGMMMGGAIGGNMANMMNGMMQGMNNPQPPAPPAAAVAQYYLAVNGQQAGPYTLAQLQQMAQNGQLTRTTYVWKAGMAAWDMAANVPEVAQLFVSVPPPPPMMPPVPPVPGM